MKYTFISFLMILIINATSAQSTAKEWYDKGKTLGNSSKFSEAIIAYEKAIGLDKGYHEAYYSLGFVYNEKKEYAKAIENLEKVIELKPQHARAFNELSYANRKLGKYTEALEYVNKAIAIRPDNAAAYKELGDVYIELYRDEDAFTAYKKAYSLDNKNSAACYELGYWNNSKGNYKEALIWLNRGALVEQSTNIYNEIGLAHSYLKENDAAIAAYTKSIQIDPYNSTAFRSIGDIYRLNYKPAKIDDAIDYYNRAISANSKNAEAYYGIGWCNNELYKYDDAITNLKKATEINSSLSNAYTELGYAQYMKGYNTDALANLDKAIAKNSKDDNAVYYKGLVYCYMKDKPNALKALELLKTLNTKSADKLTTKINSL
ncbi:MAG: tetratricopeptide repeat protein [Bacteroidota bacterium]